MCGIIGVAGSDAKTIAKMLPGIAKRGPDGHCFWMDDFCTLGHTLLSITDQPQNATQPWNSPYGVLTYNGELYNYPELKKEWASRLKTQTDTEVLSHGLSQHGKDYIKQLKGMWAFAWYDKHDKRIILSRDNSGIKPLYYSIYKDRLYFASSIKSLLDAGVYKEISPAGLKLYLTFGYVPGPLTLFRGIKKVLPGQTLEYDLTSQKFLQEDEFNLQRLSNKQFTFEEFDYQLEQAVSRSMMGIRNVGLLLSGGLDSSLIYLKAKKLGYDIKTFSTKFNDEEFDEDCRCACLTNPRNNVLEVTYEHFFNAQEKAIACLEEPRFARNLPAYYLMMQHVAANDVTVILSGEGGDEIFTGYDRHPLIKPLGKIRNRLGNWIELNRLNKATDEADIVRDMKKWFPYQYFGKDHVNNMLFIEQMTHLAEDYFTRIDKLAMNFGLENRVPLMYDSFKNYVMGIPGEFKMNKAFLKEWYKDFLPEHVLAKKKSGWSVPYKEWYAQPEMQDRIDKAVRWFVGKFDLPWMQELINNGKTKIAILHLNIWARANGVL